MILNLSIFCFRNCSTFSYEETYSIPVLSIHFLSSLFEYPQREHRFVCLLPFPFTFDHSLFDTKLQTNVIVLRYARFFLKGRNKFYSVMQFDTHEFDSRSNSYNEYLQLWKLIVVENILCFRIPKWAVAWLRVWYSVVMWVIFFSDSDTSVGHILMHILRYTFLFKD